MSDNFGPKYVDQLKSFISTLPKDYKFFFEVRNEHWFNDENNKRQYFDLLANYGVGTIISDTTGRRDCVHMEITTNELFLRFVGNGGEFWDHDYKRIDEWVDRIGIWIYKGLKKVYFCVHQYDETYSPKLAAYVIDRLNMKLNAGLKPIDL